MSIKGLSSFTHLLSDLFFSVNLTPTKEPKKKIKVSKVIVEGSQEGKIGKVNNLATAQFLNKLQALAPSGVHFSQYRLVTHLNGGTCSSMALNLVQDYFKLRLQDEDMDLAIELTKKYSKSGINFRSEQVAMNTIETTNAQNQIDIKRAKVQAIANPYDLKITDASRLLELENLIQDSTLLRDTLSTMDNGVYILRDLFVSSYNHKGERWGHTMVLFKFEEGYLLYDPNHGLIQISEKEVVDKLLEHFVRLEEEWCLHEPRFYKVKSVAERTLGL